MSEYDNVNFKQLITYYKKVPHNFFLKHWKRIGKQHPHSFKVSVEYKLKSSLLWETWWIEENLYMNILQGEK